MGVVRDKARQLSDLLKFRSRRSRDKIEEDVKKLRNEIVGET